MRVEIIGTPCAKMDSLKAELRANDIKVESNLEKLFLPDQAISNENIFELKTITELSHPVYPLGKFKHKGQPWKKKGKNRRF